ncbi:DNA-protecting protein DprA [Candidatus Peregrinibacteria bacterium HGW-Peregrinibacteria-1]|jgi:DNA processing protein|nr:MAG: DNA-protecting protein DprA [Candidatus Peregrinibacteria bacterium HGW-Peregrinibacteria-1]
MGAKHNIIVAADGKYPFMLKKISKPPKKLFYRGELGVVNGLCVAVVGTRYCSDYGLSMTRKIVADLVEFGAVIVSGLALGVDSMAHSTALEMGGKTVAVLGSGLDNVYPNYNRGLADKIVASGRGLVVSELEPDAKGLAFHFPMRNRIISGLSQAVVVVEAPKKSGALITAKYALGQNRDVFVVPGDVDRSSGRGILELMQSGGGFPVSCGADIFDYMKLQPSLFAASKNVDEGGVVNSSPEGLEGYEKKIYGVLNTRDWKSADFITRKLLIPVVEVLSNLTMLELKGLVEGNSGRFRRSKL